MIFNRKTAKQACASRLCSVCGSSAEKMQKIRISCNRWPPLFIKTNVKRQAIVKSLCTSCSRVNVFFAVSTHTIPLEWSPFFVACSSTRLAVARFNRCIPVSCSGVVYVCGGWNEKSECLSSIECYQPDSGAWTFIRSMRSAREGHSVAVNQGWLALKDVIFSEGMVAIANKVVNENGDEVQFSGVASPKLWEDQIFWL